MGTEVYYPSLDGVLQGCRVFELLPGSLEDDLHIRLKVVQLVPGDVQPYKAISYTWGDRKDPEKAFLHQTEPPSTPNGLKENWNSLGPSRYTQPEERTESMSPLISEKLGAYIRGQNHIFITRNLASALRHIRQRAGSQLLWADIVCINQSDTEERNAQVKLFPSIFCCSSQVIVWLGPEAEDSDYAMESLRSWSEKARFDYISRNVILNSLDPTDHWIASLDREIPHTDRGFVSCYALIRRPWFERTWIRQEISLSSAKATVRCGDQSIGWREFHSALQCMFYRRADPLIKNYWRFSIRRKLVRSLEAPNRHGIEGLLVYARGSVCDDPRDKVFGILGMLENSETWIADALRTDYSLDVVDVYASLFHVVASGKRNLSLLSHCAPTPEEKWAPTWVPNWGSKSKYLGNIDEEYAGLAIRSGTIDRSGSQLRVKGVIAACLSAVEVWPLEANNCLLLDDVRDAQLKRIFKNLVPAWSCGSRRDLVQAMAQTMHQMNIPEHSRGIPPATVWEVTAADVETCISALVQGTAFCEHKEYIAGCGICRADAAIKTWCSEYYTHRSLAVTDTGLLALVPGQAQPGDVLAVLLGLPSVILIRPQCDGAYEVVGTSYAPGLNLGEALAGPLPAGWQYVIWFDLDGRWTHAFENSSSDVLTFLDPRIAWEELRVDDRDPDKFELLERGEEGHFKLPDEAYLRRHGVPLQDITLV